MSLKFRFLWILFAVSATALWFYSCKNSNHSEQAFYKNLDTSVTYVGKEVCSECHAEQYNTFIETGMGSSFGEATADRSHAVWEHVSPIYDPKTDLYYQPFKSGKALCIREFRLRNGDTVHNRVETISYIIGSGQHTNSHFWSENGYLFQAPLTYYTQSGKWDLAPGFEITNTRFNRKIDEECMNCHNAISKATKGSLNQFGKLANGIDCERCHGPGSLHVSEKKKGIVVDVSKEADPTIVNPLKLPWKLQVDICQRCHLQGNNVLKPGKNFTDFRPGMHLDSVFTVFMPERNGKKTFFMAGHAERLQMSACFKKSNTSNTEKYNPGLNLTCITCHNPHVSVTKTSKVKFNDACQKCHSKNGNSSFKKCSAGESMRMQEQNSCVTCHMPSNGTSDIPHVTVHDHYIRRPETLKINQNSNDKITGIYAVNGTADKSVYIRGLITWFEKFNAESALMQVAATEMQGSGIDAGIEIHYHYANQDYEGILPFISKINPDATDAWTCYRIAKALDQTGQLEASLTWYRIAKYNADLNLDFAAEYANALLRAKRTDESMKVSEQMLKRFPKHALSLINLGGCEVLKSLYANAKKHLLKAVALEPDNLNARMYLYELYLRTHEPKLAEAELKEARRINPKITGNVTSGL